MPEATAPEETTASILPTGSLTFLVADGSHGQTVSVFDAASDALDAARQLRATLGGGARIALHTGEARVRSDGHYTGPAVHTCARLSQIGNAGQTLISSSTASMLASAATGLVDLGLHRLRDLSSPMRIFALDDANGAPLQSLERVPNNLPVHLTSFVGRQSELAAVRDLLLGQRLLTITGVGGAGKTRLAAQVAADLVERWPDGVWWVELGSVSDSAHVADVVASTIGVLVEPVRGPLRSLVVHARQRRVLICLDNCEQVLDGVAELAEAVLRACPEVVIVTTSREPLGVPGEAVWRVPPLAVDDALALFVERAGVVRPWFTLDASSEAAVRTMCARLDGVPLALELAAAWLRTLTPRQIEAGLDDRFALLVRGPRGAVQRQQTLAASIDWSHALLDESDRIVLRRLAVLAGGFGLEAARAVCGAAPIGRDDVLEALGRLVDKSLVVAEAHAGERSGELSGEARYRLQETIREYAAERLVDAGEVEPTRDRHLAYFLALAEAIEPALRRDMDTWLSQVELEHDNLRVALEWGLAASDADRGRRLAATLPWLWHLHRSGAEGIEYLRRAIGRAPDERSTLQARLLTGIALVADTASPLDLEFDAAQRALAIATEQGDEQLRALCLSLSAVGQFYTDFDAARALCDEALAAGQAAGDAFVIDAMHALQGIILHLRDRHGEAEPCLASAVEGLLRRHRGVAASTLAYQASGALYTGELERARRLAEQAVQVAEPLGDYLRVGSTRGVLALVNCLAGDIEAGVQLMRPVLQLVEGAENDVFVPGLGRAMGALHLARGEPLEAATWFGREVATTDRGTRTWLAVQSLPGLAAALAALGRVDEAADVLAQAVAEARGLDMPRVLADALEQQAQLAEDQETKLDLHHQALAIRAEHGLRTFCVDSLEALTALAEPGAETVRVLAASSAARSAMGYPRGVTGEQVYDATVARLREAIADTPFEGAWTDGERLGLDEAVAYVRRGRGARGRPSTGWGSLTPTELDVVRLIVDGLNNPDIGGQLFMSRGTVKTHLSHVYAKLGVANRTELASLAAGRLGRD